MSRRILLSAFTEVGAGALERLPEILRHLAVSRPFIVVDAGLPAAFNERLKAIVGSTVTSEIVRGPMGEPTTDAADEFASLARSMSCDGVVAVGGGSVMDLGKAISMLVGHSGRASDYQGPDLVTGAGLPVVCVPTTAGSGAEATKSAVLTNAHSQVKRGINAVGVLPDAVILDPLLLLSLPARPRIAALLDATTHALESYVGKSTWGISEMTAATAFPLLGDHLRHDGDSLTLEQAEGALMGSFLAGASICNSETGAVHALAYPLTEYHGIPHAYAVGTLLPEVMLLQKDACARRLDEAAQGMGFHSPVEFLERATQLRDRLGTLPELREIVSDHSALSRIVERAMSLTGALDNSPRTWTQLDAETIYSRFIE